MASTQGSRSKPESTSTMNNKLYLLLALLCVALPLQAQLAPPQVTVTPLPVGSGARALGRGGAFTAVADDATAGSWNPAGLVQLDYAEFSIVGSYLRTVDAFSTPNSDIQIGKESFERPDINYASLVFPAFSIAGKQVRCSLNYQQVYDFHLDLSFDQTLRGETSVVQSHLDVKSKGAVCALSPAAAIAVTPRFWIGGAVNFHRDELLGDDAWKVSTTSSGKWEALGSTSDFHYRNTETYENFDGVNATFGVMWEAWRDKEKGDKSLTLGCTFETPYTAHVVREVETVSRVDDFRSVAPRNRTRFDMDFPMSASLGADLRLSDAWSVSGDFQWTKWSDFVQIDKSIQEGELHRKSSPIGGVSHDGLESSKIADTYAVRVGTEYVVIGDRGKVPLRAGLLWEQRPSLGHAEPYWGFSLGSGLITERFSFDFAYQLRHAYGISGRDLGIDRSLEFNSTEHMFLASVIVYF